MGNFLHILGGVLIVVAIIIIFHMTPRTTVQAEPQIKDFEYAIIFYPNMRKSVEGYIDRYVLYGGDTMEVTIDGTSYLTNTKNIMLIKSRDLKVEKEKEVINVQEPEQSDN